MNRHHLRAILWLRWRLMVNTARRAGIANAVLTVALAVGAFIAASALFIGSIVIGVSFLPRTQPVHLLYLWDGLVLTFCFFWTLGVITELQRSDALALDKLLHLPVSLRSAFLCNYLGSLASVSILLLVPPMVGLSIALVITKGSPMVLLFPLIASLIFMVSAVTYQFRGWVAALFVNKRRKRSVLAIVTITFILLAQAPNLLNISVQRAFGQRELRDARRTELAELKQQFENGSLERSDYDKRRAQLNAEYRENQREARQRTTETVQRALAIANVALPIGWLPNAAAAAAEGRIQPSLLAILGSLLIGLASLHRAFRTTVLYFVDGLRAKPAKRATRKTDERRPRRPLLVERNVPGCSPGCSAIAMANLLSLARAPEAKIILLTPVIVMVIFGGLLFTNDLSRIPSIARPAVAIGLTSMGLFSILQLIQNQFGFDRDGFRAFVLAPTPRHEVLLAKNLSIAPFALTLGTLAILAVQIVLPLPWDYFFAALFQLLSLFLIFCMVGNLFSILLPMRLSRGGLRPQQTKWTVFVAQLALFLVLPFLMLPTWIPLGVDLLMAFLKPGSRIPFALLLSGLELGAILWIYHKVLIAQGSLLQRRETRLLKDVTHKVEETRHERSFSLQPHGSAPRLRGLGYGNVDRTGCGAVPGRASRLPHSSCLSARLRSLPF